MDSLRWSDFRKVRLVDGRISIRWETSNFQGPGPVLSSGSVLKVAKGKSISRARLGLARYLGLPFL